MTPVLSAVHDELLSRASKPPYRVRSDSLREQFLRRTAAVRAGENVWAMVAARRGAPGGTEAPGNEAEPAVALPSRPAEGRTDGFEHTDVTLADLAQTEPEDRLLASWDDALTRGRLAIELAPTFTDPSERALVRVISTAQRGIYQLRKAGGRTLAVDAVGGAEFLMLERDDIIRAVPEDTLDTTLVDGRVVAASDGCSMLPGVIFHPPDAIPLLDAILQGARRMLMGREDLCDALLRMNHAFRCSSRVKIGFAYNPEALAHHHARERSSAA